MTEVVGMFADGRDGGDDDDDDRNGEKTFAPSHQRAVVPFNPNCPYEYSCTATEVERPTAGEAIVAETAVPYLQCKWRKILSAIVASSEVGSITFFPRQGCTGRILYKMGK